MTNKYETDMTNGRSPIDEGCCDLYEGIISQSHREETSETGTLTNQDVEITSDGTVGIPRSLKYILNLF